jgi:hypothetical protein
MRTQLRRRAVLGTITAVAITAVAGSAVALAAKPVKGATYSGNITKVFISQGRRFPHTWGISFKVSRNGKKVTTFEFPNDYPIYCQGGGFGTAQKGSGKVSKKGTFKVKVPLYFAPEHQHQGFLIVTGKFRKHGKESGKVKTDFTTGTVCNGTSKYSTKA